MRTPRAHVYRPRPRWHPVVGQLVEAYAHGRIVAVGYVESVASCRVRLRDGVGWTKIDYDGDERGRRLMRGGDDRRSRLPPRRDRRARGDRRVHPARQAAPMTIRQLSLPVPALCCSTPANRWRAAVTADGDRTTGTCGGTGACGRRWWARREGGQGCAPTVEAAWAEHDAAKRPTP